MTVRGTNKQSRKLMHALNELNNQRILFIPDV